MLLPGPGEENQDTPDRGENGSFSHRCHSPQGIAEKHGSRHGHGRNRCVNDHQNRADKAKHMAEGGLNDGLQ